MAKSFSQSHDAYNRGDHAAAKEFSNAGKAHQRKMEQVNKEASDWIFRGQSVSSQLLYQSQLGRLSSISSHLPEHTCHLISASNLSSPWCSQRTTG